MTIVTVVRDRAAGKTWLGSNSRSLVGDAVMPSDRSKWTVIGDWAIALTGAGVMTDILMAAARDFPKRSEDGFAVGAFLRKSLREAEVGKEEDGLWDFDISGLLAHRGGGVFDFDCQISVEPVNEGALWASGSGGKFALGAAHALKDETLSAEELTRRAVETAIALDSGCPGHAIIEEF